MAGIIGLLVGCTLAVMLLTALWRLLFRRFLTGYKLALTSVLAAVATAVILYGFGGADGGEPDFTSGIVPYGVAGLIVFGLLCLGVKRSSKANDG